MKTQQKKLIISTVLSIILLLSFLSIVYTIFIQNSQNSNLSSLYKFGQFFGLIGFISLAFLIISGDTARFFDKYYGIDRIIKFQRKFAIFTYFIVFSHPIFFILSQSSYLNYLLPQFQFLPLTAATFSIYIFAAVMISSLNYKKISYSLWQYIHLGTYLLFILVLYHSLNSGQALVSHPQIKAFYFILPLSTAIGAIYRANYKTEQRRNKYIIKKITKLTPDTFELTITPKNRVQFKSGQFFFLRIEGKKLYARHPFSISSSPEEKDISFTIKIAGRFTKEALSLNPGDEIKAEGPFGNFISKNNNESVFIAGGVGIAPFMSMLKSNKGKKITLLYGSKTEKDIIHKKDLDKIKEPWLKKVYVLSQENNPKYEKGRIDKDIILKYVKDIENKTFYICGKKEMSDSMTSTLKKIGVKSSNIIKEDFFW